MKRRDFLQASSALSLPVLLNGMPLKAMAKSSFFRAMNQDNDRILVLVQLNGGNDGLNTVVPIDSYDNLVNARSNLVLPENSLLKIEDTVGLHPNMGGLQSLYDDAKVRIIQSVGYPNQNRSHFRSTDIWTSASAADEFETTGWLGRYFEQDYPDFPEGYPNGEKPDPFALTLGAIVSETCQGTAANYSLAINDPFSLSPLTESEEGSVPDTPYGHELTFLRTAIEQTNAYASTIEDAANNGTNMAVYDDQNRLAQSLKNVALLISGGLQTSIYVVTLGGFDTHANQAEEGDSLTGAHAELLQNVSDAIKSFQDDLKAQGLEERVMGMTFSEFGRQIKSNESLGTDHGTAAPLIVFGKCINPGILGDNPEIPAQVQDQEGVAMQYDFRSVYGSMLMDWFELPEDDVRALLYEDFQRLPILDPCTTTSIDERDSEELSIWHYPNPMNGSGTIVYQSKGEWARISLFNAFGHELKVISERKFPEGEHRIPINTSDLVPGNYYYRVLTDRGQKTKALIKQ